MVEQYVVVSFLYQMTNEQEASTDRVGWKVHVLLQRSSFIHQKMPHKLIQVDLMFASKQFLPILR